MTTIVKATTKGQITLPAPWRKKFNTNQFLLTYTDDIIQLKPIELSKIMEKEQRVKDLTKIIKAEEKEGWGEPIFDAIRDNDGEGIKANDLLKALRKMNGQNK